MLERQLEREVQDRGRERERKREEGRGGEGGERRGQGGEEVVGRKCMLPYLAVSGCSNTSDHSDNDSTHLQLYFLGIHETSMNHILYTAITFSSLLLHSSSDAICEVKVQLGASF